MPNWCSNWLTVRGEAAYLDALIANVGREGRGDEEASALSLEAILPTPVDLYEVGATREEAEAVRTRRRRRWGVDDAVDYHLAHWGTKWDVVASLERTADTCALFSFDSANNPPMEAIAELSRQYPMLSMEIEYDEEGCDSWGTSTYLGGLEIDREEGPSKARAAWQGLQAAADDDVGFG